MTAQFNIEMIADDLRVKTDELLAVMEYCKITMNHDANGFVWHFSLELGKDCPQEFIQKLDGRFIMENEENPTERYVVLACELDVMTPRGFD